MSKSRFPTIKRETVKPFKNTFSFVLTEFGLWSNDLDELFSTIESVEPGVIKVKALKDGALKTATLITDESANPSRKRKSPEIDGASESEYEDVQAKKRQRTKTHVGFYVARPYVVGQKTQDVIAGEGSEG
jgi:hypothetical protein